MEKTHRISAKVERAVSFSSMIFLAHLEGVDQLNDELTSLILERQNSDSGRQRSNRGGWSSGNDTLRWPDAAM